MILKKILLFKVFIIILLFTIVILIDYNKILRFNISKIFKPLFSFHATSLYPYFTGYELLLRSNYILDDYLNNINTFNIKNGDIIFVKSDFIGKFFHNYYPKINQKFILITHNSDYSPDKNYAKYLDEKKLIVWFMQNPIFEHQKLIPLPIGIENNVWELNKHDYIRSINLKSLIKWNNRKYLIYINFNAKTNIKSRLYLLNYFQDKFDSNSLLVIKNRTNYTTFYTNLANSKYVICPRGNGLDTHRVYESILMGSIPIVENSTLYPVYKQATVLVVDNFKSINPFMLDNPELFIENMNFSRDILYADTWVKKIESYRKANLIS